MKPLNSLPMEAWEPLIDSLRREVEEYGGFLNLIVEEQNCILERRTDRLFELAESISDQADVCKKACTSREKRVNELGQETHKAQVSLSEIIPFAPQKIQGLLIALGEEISSLAQRTQYKARQNQNLLLRAYALSERLLSIANPRSAKSKTYNKKGLITTCSQTSMCVDTMR